MGGRAILVLGDINVDVMARLAVALAPGGDNLPQQMELQLGGVGANVAVALAKWSVEARLAGCAGRDAFGDFAMGALERQGVDVGAVARADAATGLIFIPVDPDGRRTIIGARGANELAPAMRAAECMDGVAGVHLVGYSLLADATAAWLRELVTLAAERGVPVTLDVGLAPSRAARAQVRELAPRIDTLFVGQEEAESPTGASGPRALEAIAECGARVVVVKQGAAGCQFRVAGPGGRWWKIAPLEVAAVDTTGAGDAFAAGWWVGRLRGWETGDALALANACGAAAATVLGAGEAMPGPAEVMQVLESQPAGAREASAAARLLRMLREHRAPAGVPAGG
jgi:ribokinase